MLNDPRSHGLWEKTAPEAPTTSPLDGAISADVVIVGGGYTGLSSALHLAEAGSKVVLLDVGNTALIAGQSMTLVIVPPLAGTSALRSFYVAGCNV